MKFQSFPAVTIVSPVFETPCTASTRFGTKPDNERDDDDEG